VKLGGPRGGRRVRGLALATSLVASLGIISVANLGFAPATRSLAGAQSPSGNSSPDTQISDTQSSAGAASLPIASGQTEGIGLRLEFNIPGFIASNTLIDLGGPDSQASVGEVGESGGEAAASFPYTGQLQSVVTLVEGLESGHLPDIPNIPGQVSVDYPLSTSANETQGPYSISAQASQSDASASASIGGQLLNVGSAIAATATSSVTQTATSFVATSTSTLTGLQIGPIAIGQLTSTATETLGTDGTVTPSTAIALTGLQVPGFPGISVGPSGVTILGVPTDLSITKVLNGVLASSGFSVSFSQAQNLAGGGVEAPDMTFTGPVSAPGFAPGTFTLTVGGSTAVISAAALAGPPPVISLPLLPTLIGPGSLVGEGTSDIAASSVFAPTTGGLSSSSSAPTGSPSGTPSKLAVGGTSRSADLLPIGPGSIFDLRGLYLALLLATLLVLGLATTVRYLGVRGPWNRS
jgi:hypothetical protein